MLVMFSHFFPGVCVGDLVYFPGDYHYCSTGFPTEIYLFVGRIILHNPQGVGKYHNPIAKEHIFLLDMDQRFPINFKEKKSIF